MLLLMAWSGASSSQGCKLPLGPALQNAGAVHGWAWSWGLSTGLGLPLCSSLGMSASFTATDTRIAFLT